jgi:hypothetical protein
MLDLYRLFALGRLGVGLEGGEVLAIGFGMIGVQSDFLSHAMQLHENRENGQKVNSDGAYVEGQVGT